MNAVTDQYLSAFGEVERTLPGAGVAWLDDARRNARSQFGDLGFPTPRQEDWKYTRVAQLEKRIFQPAPETCVGLDPDDLDAYDFAGLSAYRLVFVNGRYAPQLTPRLELPESVAVKSLAQALSDDADALEPHLGRYADAGAHGFSALNTAFLGDGAYIHVPRNTKLDRPIHLLFLTTAQDADIAIQPRVLVVAEEGSRADVIENYASMGDSGYFTNALTEVMVGVNAEVHHYKTQCESDQAFHIATLQVQQERDSRFISHSVSLGGRLARNDINIKLDAPGAECTLNGLYVTGGRQHVDYHTRVDHLKPHGTSHEFYKGILSGRSRGVFNGRVYVHPDAQKTDAVQSNRNLLLSKDAEVDTKPQLEIFADDVKCAHGATVGQLDENMVFYLRSRGIDEGTARALLTYGFAREIVAEMAIPAIRESVERRALARIPNTAPVRETLL